MTQALHHRQDCGGESDSGESTLKSLPLAVTARKSPLGPRKVNSMRGTATASNSTGTGSATPAVPLQRFFRSSPGLRPAFSTGSLSSGPAACGDGTSRSQRIWTGCCKPGSSRQRIGMTRLGGSSTGGDMRVGRCSMLHRSLGSGCRSTTELVGFMSRHRTTCTARRTLGDLGIVWRPMN